MAEEEEPVGEEPEEEQAKTKEARQLDSLTDHVSERELSGDRVKAALEKLASEGAAKAEEAAKREKALAAVKVADADVAVLAQELELDKKAADRRLREHGGDLKKALLAAVSAA